MPPRRAVELRVGGQTYRVVATEDDRQVQHLAELVDRKYLEVVPQTRGVTPQQAMFLTALALAHEVEELRERAARVEAERDDAVEELRDRVARTEAERDHAVRLAEKARDVVGRALAKVDSALSPKPGAAETGRRSGPASSAEPAVWTDEAEETDETDASSLDAIVDPPDAVNEPVMIDLLQSLPPDVRQSLPGDVRPSHPGDGRQSHPGDGRRPHSESGVPRGPRGGLRLVRQTGTPDDDPRRS